jgi:anti-sigma factor RsiW
MTNDPKQTGAPTPAAGLGPEEQRFVSYVDGDMPPEEMEAFEKELDTNPDLSRRFDEYRRTVHLLHNLPRPRAPQGLLPGLQRRMLQRRSPPPLPRFPYETVLFVCLMAALIFVYATYMAPTSGTVARIVMVQLSGPVPQEVVADFGLTRQRSDNQVVALTARLSEARARALLSALQPVLPLPPDIPAGETAYEVILRPPPTRE